MAGGKGERLGLGGVEKPLLEFRGRPLIGHVFAALNKSQIERVVTVTSPRTPCTTRWAREANIQVVRAPGQGYIKDYMWASKRLGLQGPVLIIAADLPLIDYRLIDRIIERRSKAESSALGVYLPCEFCDEANVSPDFAFAADDKLLVPTGINIVDASRRDQLQEEQMFIIRDESLLYNINRRSDLSRLIRRASPVGERKQK
jgi:adenosylcobinamide-phosphate guanylyltransferase